MTVPFMAQMMAHCIMSCSLLSAAEDALPSVMLSEIATHVTQDEYSRGYSAGVHDNWDGTPRMADGKAWLKLLDIIERDVKDNKIEELVSILDRKHDANTMLAYPIYSKSLVSTLLRLNRLDDSVNSLIAVSRALRKFPEYEGYYSYSLSQITREMAASPRGVSIPPNLFEDIASNICGFMGMGGGDNENGKDTDDVASIYLFRSLNTIVELSATDDLFKSKSAMFWLLRMSNGMPPGSVSWSEFSILANSLIVGHNGKSDERGGSISLSRIGGLLVAISQQKFQIDGQESSMSPLSILILRPKVSSEESREVAAEVVFSSVSALEARHLLGDNENAKTKVDENAKTKVDTHELARPLTPDGR